MAIKDAEARNGLMKGLAASHNGMPRVTAPSAKPNQQAKSQDSKPESSKIV